MAAVAGAVYVFTRTGTTWTQQAYIKASNTDANDEFGWSVALDGDTLVVGAQGESSAATDTDGDQADNSAGSAGAVYVFTRTGTTWSQQAYLKASNTDANDEFGYAVAISGDTLAVGAIGESSAATGVGGDQADNSLIQAGAVYVFTRASGAWSQQAYVKASNPDKYDLFGFHLSLSADTLAATAINESSAATGIDGDGGNNAALDAGAVYVFARSGTTWAQQAYVKASNTAAFSGFGTSIAVSADTLAVGASNESSAAMGIDGDQRDVSADSAGAAYVFTRTGATWTQQAYVKASNTGAEDKFGETIALDGDTLAVGATGESSDATGVDGNQADDSSTDAGAVYLFTRTNTTWSQQAYLKASNTTTDAELGYALVVGGDTIATSAVGDASNATGIDGNGADTSAPASGAIYIFE